ncbi:MAG: sigma-70 family RNA polymerase sigma factor [Clostridia bacterium]|nr:sigma-70 family RNA polymerase sigma factor [Clostridia bacterium]
MTAENELFKKYRETKDKKIRDELVSRYTYVAKILAYKFLTYGVEFDDLYQVACMGLILAIDRFDPDRNVQFTTFLTPTVIGEIRRFLRDKVPAIRMPRRLYDALSKAESEKMRSGNLSITELSKRLNIPVETLNEAYTAGDTNFMKSLEDEAFSDSALSNFLGYDDYGFALIENRDFLDYCISKMDEREQAVLKMRFFEGKTQTETADALGLSQMSVSRIEKKVIEKIKKDFLST